MSQTLLTAMLLAAAAVGFADGDDAVAVIFMLCAVLVWTA